MPLTLTLRTATPIPLEVFGVHRDAVCGRSPAEIERLPVLYGRNASLLAEHFQVSGSATDDETIIWQGDLTAVKGIAAESTGGCVRIQGSTGMHCAAGLRGGEVIVEGHVSDWAGADMRKGRLTVLGSAGRCLGGAYRGALKGMTGGEILVHGDCGDEAGQLMRRGLIAIRGNAGQGLGYGLLAGTIALAGSCGSIPLAGMKRGTLLALTRPKLLPSFRESTPIELVVVRLLVRHLGRCGLPEFTTLLDQPLRRFWGDFTAGGRGEILFPA